MSLLVLILSWGSMGLEAATAVVSAGGEAPGPGAGPEGKDLGPGPQVLRSKS